jgi:hypothetical protein
MMSEFSEFCEYVLKDVRAKGHIVGPLYWRPIGGVPTHEARCKICDGVIQLWWCQEERMWLADGDLQESGKRFLMRPKNLPPPKSDPVAASRSLLIPYAGQAPRLMEGFTATAFIIGLEHPRRLLVLPNNDVIVAEQKTGYLTLLSGFANARAGITHGDLERSIHSRCLDHDLAYIRELDGVTHKVENRLRQPSFITANSSSLVPSSAAPAVIPMSKTAWK